MSSDYSSIRRHGRNDDYLAQDLPYAGFPIEPGVVYRAGIHVGGRRCPRCSTFIAVTSRIVRLHRPEDGRWWVHERCLDVVVSSARHHRDRAGGSRVVVESVEIGDDPLAQRATQVASDMLGGTIISVRST